MMSEILLFASVSVFLPGCLADEIQIAMIRDALARDDAKGFNAAFHSYRSKSSQPRLTELVISNIQTEKHILQRELIRSLSSFSRELQSTAVPVLIRIVADEQSDNREIAIICLGDCGPPAKIGIRALTDCLKTENSDSIRAKACWALWKIDKRTEPIAPTLTSLLDPTNHSLGLTLSVIAEIGKPLKTTTVGPAVLALVEHRNMLIRWYVYPLIQEFAASHAHAAEILGGLFLRAADQRDIQQALFLKQFKEGTLPNLLELKRLPTDLAHVEVAFVALGEAGVPELSKFLKLNDHPSARFSALLILRDMGKAGAKATDDVRKLTTHPDESVRHAAKETLKSITGG